jgi:hypothetical protein
MCKILLAGYGTFVTEAMETLKENMMASQYYWNIKILGFSHLKGWRRVLLPRDTHPYIIRDENSYVDILVAETDEGMLELCNDAEGYPYHYDRIEVMTDFGLAFIYVPAEEVLPGIIERFQASNNLDDEWKQWIKRSVLHNKIAIEKFPQLLEV